MKVTLTTYFAAEHGVTLKVVPETDVEKELLKGFGRHGSVAFNDGNLDVYFKFYKTEDKG